MALSHVRELFLAACARPSSCCVALVLVVAVVVVGVAIPLCFLFIQKRFISAGRISCRTSTMALLSSPQQLLASVPLTTRIFTGSTIALSILYYFLQWSSTAPNFAPYLTLIPGISIFYPWTLFTAGLVETTVIEVRDLQIVQILV